VSVSPGHGVESWLAGIHSRSSAAYFGLSGGTGGVDAVVPLGRKQLQHGRQAELRAPRHLDTVFVADYVERRVAL
jgi:hypothetical protein